MLYTQSLGNFRKQIENFGICLESFGNNAKLRVILSKVGANYDAGRGIVRQRAYYWV